MELVTKGFIKTILQKIKERLDNAIPYSSTTARRKVLTPSDLNSIVGESHFYMPVSLSTANLPVEKAYGFFDSTMGGRDPFIYLQEFTVVGINEISLSVPKKFIRQKVGSNAWTEWYSLLDSVSNLETHAIQDTNT